jgi:phosphoenolpyruvate carboxykinase (ATP)
VLENVVLDVDRLVDYTNVSVTENTRGAYPPRKLPAPKWAQRSPRQRFSACFGGPFLVWHPNKYAELLAAKMKQHGTRVWLVNTGWSGGAYGIGKRIKLPNTRAIIDAIRPFF